jgi:hypothetical protein
MYGRAGRTSDAEGVLQDLERRYRRGDAASYDLSLPLLGLGRSQEALDWLERACDARSGLLVFLGGRADVRSGSRGAAVRGASEQARFDLKGSCL